VLKGREDDPTVLKLISGENVEKLIEEFADSITIRNEPILTELCSYSDVFTYKLITELLKLVNTYLYEGSVKTKLTAILNAMLSEYVSSE
jgi:hypothetical protein